MRKKIVLFIAVMASVFLVQAQTDSALWEYTGKYMFPADDSVMASVSYNNNVLAVSSIRGEVTIKGISADTFRIVEYAGKVIFFRNQDKSISGIKVNIPEHHINAEGIRSDLIKKSVVNMANTVIPDTKENVFIGKFDLEAHQGGAGLYPGNTIPAFLNAVSLGVNTLELDCVISKDKMVVVSHDQFMNYNMLRPDGKPISKEDQLQYNIYMMTYDSVKKYDAGSLFNQEFPDRKLVNTCKPLLSEVIDAVEKYTKSHHLQPVHYNIEIKSLRKDDVYHPAPAPFTDLLMAVLQQKKIEERVLIQSFDVRVLQYLRKQYPAMKISYLVSKRQTNMQSNLNMLGFIPEVYSSEYTIVDANMVKQAHTLNMAVIPWTVDKATDIQQIIESGCDGIISNYPDRVLKLKADTNR